MTGVSGRVRVCPRCDDSEIHERETAPPPARFRCRGCGHVFDRPAVRPKRKRRGGELSMASVLDAMDADDVGGVRS